MNTQTQQENPYIEEDEIDLKELFSVIWKNKFKIAFFTFIITSLTIVYTLSIPNSYKSSTTLVPQGQAKSSLGGLGALAGIAGIDIGGGSELDISTSLSTILNDYSFQEMMIKKYALDNKLEAKLENLVFAMKYDGVYIMINDSSKKEEIKKTQEEINFDTFKALQKIITISSDKKSGIITLSAEHQDRFLTKELVEIYLTELTTKLRTMEMENVDKQLDYYNKELSRIEDINIKQQLGQLVSGLVQKKVLSMANIYYNVKQFTLPQVAYIKDKSKPKRGLIVVVSFVTSIILGIFGIFLLEFLRKDPEKK